MTTKGFDLPPLLEKEVILIKACNVHEENGCMVSVLFSVQFSKSEHKPIKPKHRPLTTLLELVHALVKLKCIIIILSF